MTLAYATVRAPADDRSALQQITEWLEKWGPNLPLRLEKSENKERVFEVMAPREALHELPTGLFKEGIEW